MGHFLIMPTEEFEEEFLKKSKGISNGVSKKTLLKFTEEIREKMSKQVL